MWRKRSAVLTGLFYFLSQIVSGQANDNPLNPFNLNAMARYPANLLQDSARLMAISYTKHRLLPELDLKQIGGKWLTGKRAFGFSLTQTGDHRLKQTLVNGCADFPFGEGFHLGLRLSLLQLSSPEPYGNRTRVFTAIGCRFRLSPEYECMLNMIYPGQFFKNPEVRSPLNSELSFGLIRHFSRRFRTYAAIETVSRHQTDLFLAFAYLPREPIGIYVSVWIHEPRGSIAVFLPVRSGWIVGTSLSAGGITGFKASLTLAIKK